MNLVSIITKWIVRHANTAAQVEQVAASWGDVVLLDQKALERTAGADAGEERMAIIIKNPYSLTAQKMKLSLGD